MNEGRHDPFEELAKLNGRQAVERAALDERHAQERADYVSKWSAAMIEPGHAISINTDPKDEITIGEAAKLAKTAKNTMRTWCGNNPMKTGGFAKKRGGRWLVSKSRLLRHLASVSGDKGGSASVSGD